MAGAHVSYTWSLQPAVIAACAFLAWVYAARLRRLGHLTPRDVLRAASFGAGLIVLLAALVSPIDTLGEERLFCIHMVQHLLLLDIAPILLLLGLSRPILRPLTRWTVRVERRLGALAHPLTALAVLAAVVWTWHIAALYDLALRSQPVHDLEHITFLGAGSAFWWFVIEPIPPRHRLSGIATLGYATGAKLMLGALGVALAFSTHPLYPAYESAPRTWGLSAVEDMNIGGVVMLLEQSLVLVIFFAILFARMLERSEEAERRRERFGLTR